MFMPTESSWSLYWNPPIHTSMLEGQEAVLSCNNLLLGSLLNPWENLATVCSGNGTWIPNSKDICAEHSSNSGICGFSHKLGSRGK